jgi:hypothetical protein
MASDNSAAFARLQEAIDGLASLDVLADDVAAAAVDPFRAELLGNIAANRSPGKNDWQPSKSGKPVLLGAGKALEVGSSGPVLWARLTGPEARHHLGAVKGAVRRQILPGRGSLGGISKILKRIATAEWRKRFGGANG